MDKVLFLMRFPLDDSYNLKLKFIGQMHACVSLGYDVYYLGYDANHYYLCSADNKRQKVIGKTHLHALRNYRSTVAFFDLFSALASVLQDERFSYIYMRKKLITGSAVNALRHHRDCGGKLIVEIPSYGTKEATLGIARKLASIVFGKNEKRFEELVNLYTLIGECCPESYKSKPAIEIENGVSVDTIPIRKRPELNTEIHILALASMREWHGFDRVIRGMSGYVGEKRLVLHLVGQDFDGSVQRWLELAKQQGVANDVINHGALYDEQLTAIFDECHMAVGSLAFHRIGVNTGSTLKIREYIARGIPFIYGYDDSILTGSEWFAVKFAPDDSDIDFTRVIPWLEKVYSCDDPTERIRQYARDNLSWESQLRPVFERIREV